MDRPNDSDPQRAVAVIISDADGTVVSMNRTARELAGDDKLGQPGWEVMDYIPNNADLPCNHGCISRLVAAGQDAACANRVVLLDEPFLMSCVPVHGQVVTTLTQLVAPKRPGPAIRLTPREIDVLRHLAAGLTTPEISSIVGISESTVRTHVEHMRHKLGVNTRAALVARGFVMGHLSADSAPAD